MAFSFDRIATGALEQIIGYGVGGAAQPVVEWVFRPVAYEVNRLNPNLILDPATLAVAQVRQHGKGVDYTGEASESGINSARYAALLETIWTPPSTGEAIALYQRGKLDPGALKEALIRGGMHPDYVDQYVELARVLLSPQDAAMARQQGFLTDVQARQVSALQGVEAADADLLFELSGLPPGAEQMIELWRRGEVDESRVRQSLIEGHIKLKYADDVLKLRYTPLSASIAAEALIRQRMPQEKAIQIADQNGIRREDFLLWSDMLGRPIAPGQALTLARRGEFTFDQFKEAVARSDVRTEYADDLWKLRRVIPPLFQISRLLAAGSIPHDLGVKYITEEGYDVELAHAIADAAGKAKTSKTRDLAAGQIDALYESGLETKEWAVSALVGLGYEADEAEWHLELLDARRLLAALQSRLNRIHTLYISHKIDHNAAADDLVSLGISDEARGLLLETWDEERTANVSVLTNSQIGQALKHAGMPRPDAVMRWMQNGYSEDDANWLADIAEKTPHTALPAVP